MKLVKATMLCALAGVLILCAGCGQQDATVSASPDVIALPEDGASPSPSLPPSVIPTIPPSGAPTATPDDSDLDGVAEPGATPPPSGSEGGTLADYQKKNKDVIGWIKVPGTKIDYPVVMGEDNEYYLRYDVNKKKSKYGAIFMDIRNKEEGHKRHLILYGHRMNDGSMFENLHKYEKEDFFKSNDKIEFTIDGKKSTWQIFSAHQIDDVTEQNLYATGFASSEQFADYMKDMKALSDFKNDVTVGKNDQVLTLSTCVKGYSDDARYVVHFKKLKS